MATKRKTTAAGRTYTIDTEDGPRTYPSVTTILSAVNKPALANWMAKTERELVSQVAFDVYNSLHGCAKMSKAGWANTLSKRLGKEKAGIREARRAAEIGTQVHALVEWTLRKELHGGAGEEPRLTTDEAKTAFATWVGWRQSVNLKPVAIEQTVWSHTHQYAGTLDLIAEINGELTVTDWKTGKAVYPEAKLQLVSYSKAYIEMGHAESPLPALVVRLPKVGADPGFEAVPVPTEQHEAMFDVFLAVRRVWQFLQDNATPWPSVGKPKITANQQGRRLLTKLAKAKTRMDVRAMLENQAGLLTQLEAEAPEVKAEVDAFVMAWTEKAS